MPHVLTIGMLAFFGAAVLLWMASSTVPRLREQGDALRLIARWCVTIAGLLFVYSSARDYARVSPGRFFGDMLIFAVVIVFLWGRSLAGIVAAPFANIFDSSERVKPEPLYSIAEAKRKQGRIHEAMWEVQAQLEKFPGDFRGQMLLAEIQAENANDVSGAEATIRRICSQDHSPGRIAAALSALADWRLKYEQDVEAARAAFEEIMQRFPDTEFAQMAENRLAHLGDAAALLEGREPRTIHLTVSKEFGPPKAKESTEPDAMAEAARLSNHLAEFPRDNEAREELAKLYADRFHRLDFATEQLEQLISQTNESPKHVARWLNLLADLQVRCTGDTALAAQTVQRIVDRFPNHAFGEAARQRLQTLALENKRFRQTTSVQMPRGDVAR